MTQIALHFNKADVSVHTRFRSLLVTFESSDRFWGAIFSKNTMTFPEIRPIIMSEENSRKGCGSNFVCI